MMVETPTWRDFRMKGPVPLVFWLAWFSMPFLTSLGRVELFFSLHAFGMIRQIVITSGRIGNGARVTMSIAWSSIFSVSSSAIVFRSIT